MRRISLLLIGGGLMACATTAAVQPTRSAKAQEQYDQLLAGKVAGKPVSCLPTFNQNDMVVIDEQTIAFRQGRGRVYVNHMQGSCNSLGGTYALVTKQFGNAELCRGDIGQVVDLQNHFTVGSCVFGDFVPYSKPAA
ncbi:MAG TPA: DUF6491 family protein [Sphingomicrobium sp.]|nr:DUF6491 family protein [Sphingomicrobium sp.]